MNGEPKPPRVKLSQNVTVIDIEDGAAAKKTARDVVCDARRVFDTGKTRPYSFRKKQLKNLVRFLKEEEEALCEALHKDLRKPRQGGHLAGNRLRHERREGGSEQPEELDGAGEAEEELCELLR
ncbi:hypothetical protein NQ318_013964 [Aromia moschata]|uniref:Uncharacterized protein n=1 Tax=Aromia moschata TaxID=1265417 RepID=A0AAV8Z0P0_9CUCU|nr:hypothetical protein NQ318_013964 [Aromia moschata]